MLYFLGYEHYFLQFVDVACERRFVTFLIDFSQIHFDQGGFPSNVIQLKTVKSLWKSINRRVLVSSVGRLTD